MKVIWKKLQANDLNEFCKINSIQIQQFTFRDIYMYIHTNTLTHTRNNN